MTLQSYKHNSLIHLDCKHNSHHSIIYITYIAKISYKKTMDLNKNLFDNITVIYTSGLF